MTDNSIAIAVSGHNFTQPSVFKGEVAFLTLFVTDDDGNTVTIGELWGKDGKLSFTGDADKSAQVFFDRVIELNRKVLEE